VADDGVARRDVIDAVRVAFVLVGVVVGRVPLHGHAGRRTGQVDAVRGVVGRDIALDEPPGDVVQVNSRRGSRYRRACVGLGVVGDCYVPAAGDGDAVGRRTRDGETADRDVALTGKCERPCPGCPAGYRDAL